MTGLPQGGLDVGDPGLFLHDIDPVSGRAGFVRAERSELSAAPFLDHRWRPAEAVDACVPLAELPAASPRLPQMNFIWHTSYCASTLLAACLDSPGRCLSLKEPRALVILASLKQAGRAGAPAGLDQSVFGLLGRRFAPDEQVLVKPSNSANVLIPEAAALTRGRMLLLYSDCESFVLSVARHGQAGFAYVRDRFRSLAAGHPSGRWPVGELLRLTDLELAALVWRMQMDGLEAASARLGDRARSLDCRLFQDDPGAVLAELDGFFDLGLGPARLAEVVQGPLLRRNAKQPGQAFDARVRNDERTRLRAHLGGDLTLVVMAMESAFPRPPILPPSLMAGVQEPMLRAATA